MGNQVCRLDEVGKMGTLDVGVFREHRKRNAPCCTAMPPRPLARQRYGARSASQPRSVHALLPSSVQRTEIKPPGAASAKIGATRKSQVIVRAVRRLTGDAQ